MSASVPNRPDLSAPALYQMSLPFPETRPFLPSKPEVVTAPVAEPPPIACPAPDPAARILSDIVLVPPQSTGPIAGSIFIPAVVGVGAGPRDVLDRPHYGVPCTLADVLLRLADDPTQPRNRADMRSAIRAVGRVLGRQLADIPAHPAKLGALLADASPALVGFNLARWSRVRSLTLGALRDLGIQVMQGAISPGSAPHGANSVLTCRTSATGMGFPAF